MQKTVRRVRRKVHEKEVLFSAVAGLMKHGSDPAVLRTTLHKILDDEEFWELAAKLRANINALSAKGIQRWELY